MGETLGVHQGNEFRVMDLDTQNGVCHDEPLPLSVTSGRIGEHFNGEFNDRQPTLCFLSRQTKPTTGGRGSGRDIPKLHDILHSAIECIAAALEKVQGINHVLMLWVCRMDQPQQNSGVEQIPHQSWSS